MVGASISVRCSRNGRHDRGGLTALARRGRRTRNSSGQLRRGGRGPTVRMSKLRFDCPAMNAGKTMALLQPAHNDRKRGMRLAVLPPATGRPAGQ